MSYFAKIRRPKYHNAATFPVVPCVSKSLRIDWTSSFSRFGDIKRSRSYKLITGLVMKAPSLDCITVMERIQPHIVE